MSTASILLGYRKNTSIVAALIFAAGFGGSPAYGQSDFTITSVGSDSIRPILEAWAKAFQADNPTIKFKIESPGSGEGPKALIDGKAMMAPMSRRMSGEEREAFREKFGSRPLRIRIGLDALTVFVNAKNPLRGLTMPQLAAIFSSPNICRGPSTWGSRKSITTWSRLVFGRLDGKTIELHGRNEKSGTYTLFKRIANCGGDFRKSMKVHKDSRAVIAAVAASPTAIGFAAIEFKNEKVRALDIAVSFQDDYVPYIPRKYANSDDPKLKYKNVISGKYPLARTLYVYVNKPKGKSLAKPLQDFLSFALSKKGQDIVERIGEIPMPDEWLEGERDKLAASHAP